MTLEQRVEALEKAVAKLTLPSETAEELANVMRDVAQETIKNARRPGGVLHHRLNTNAHQLQGDISQAISSSEAFSGLLP